MNVEFDARLAFFVLVAITVLVALMNFFEENWILGATATMVIAGTGFVGAGMYFEEQEDAPPQLELIASRLHGIGLLVIGLGTLFGALMLLL